jgi:hypothetical protein
MIFTAALLGLLLGFLRGGRLINLSRQRLAVPYLLPISYLCEWLASTGLLARALLGLLPQESTLMGLAIIQYVTVLVFIGLNINRPGLGLFLIGSIMNGSVIIANSGRMPIGELVSRFGTDALNRIAEAPTGTEPLVFLSDLIPFWSFGWYMVSFGDFFIAVGALLFVADLLRRPTVSNLFNIEHPDRYVYTKERSLTREERGMLFYGLYRHDYREGQKRQKDDRPT